MGFQFRRKWKATIAITLFVLLAGAYLLWQVTPGCFASPPRSGQSVTYPASSEGKFLTVSRQSQRPIRHANKANFHQEVLRSPIPVLVDFYADWCRPCRALAPVLEEVARETPDAKVVKVNVDRSPELAAHYGVRSLPSVMVFKGGKVASAHMGLLSKNCLKAMLKPAGGIEKTPL